MIYFSFLYFYNYKILLNLILSLFNKILEFDDNSADAHYGIGLIYEKQENLVVRVVLQVYESKPGETCACHVFVNFIP